MQEHDWHVHGQIDRGDVLRHMDFPSRDPGEVARGAYTPPRPPPADMPVDPDKWRALNRRTRRALLREHKRVTGHG